MIERYSRREMAAIWSDENKYGLWLEIEILACEAWSRLGTVPPREAAKIRGKARIDCRRIAQLEADTRHDVVAFTRAVITVSLHLT